MPSLVTVAGRTIAVQYPPNMEEVVECGLNGHDYPRITIPDFDPRIIVDVGANVGATALYFLKSFPGATVHCFEPARDSFRFLERNTEGFSQIVLHCAALSDRSANAVLYPGLEQCAQSSIHRTRFTRSDGETIRLLPASRTLRELELRHIGILKLDTEGCEVAIVRDLLDRDSGIRVDVFYLEYHSEEDRVRLDRMLTPTYWLAHARASKVHRGTLGYVHRCLYEAHPDLYAYRIEGG